MLDKWLQAKVGDFGLAREGSEYSNARTKFPVRGQCYKTFYSRKVGLYIIS
jgi:hypothetical protein